MGSTVTPWHWVRSITAQCPTGPMREEVLSYLHDDVLGLLVLENRITSEEQDAVRRKRSGHMTCFCCSAEMETAYKVSFFVGNNPSAGSGPRR